jgi:LysR family glycine cleavage system transcriptional activator
MYGVNWEADAPPTSAELEIRYGRGIWPGFEATELLSRGMRPYCSRTTAIGVGKNGLLPHSTLIDVLGTPVGWSEWLAKYPQSGRDTFQRLHVDSFAIAADMAVHDVGVCLLNEDLVVGSRLHDVLFSPLDQTVDDRASFYLLRPREKSISGAARAFTGWLESEVPSPAAPRSLLGGPTLAARRTTRRAKSSAPRADS